MKRLKRDRNEGICLQERGRAINVACVFTSLLWADTSTLPRSLATPEVSGLTWYACATLEPAGMRVLTGVMISPHLRLTQRSYGRSGHNGRRIMVSKQLVWRRQLQNNCKRF
jgi:hypothetical protein